MELSDGQRDAWRLGVSVMTAWLESPPAEGQPPLGPVLERVSQEQGAEGVMSAAVGLQNVAGALLLAYAEQVGAAPEDVLSRLALSMEQEPGAG